MRLRRDELEIVWEAVGRLVEDLQGAVEDDPENEDLVVRLTVAEDILERLDATFQPPSTALH
jgi:hypothetical protein